MAGALGTQRVQAWVVQEGSEDLRGSSRVTGIGVGRVPKRGVWAWMGGEKRESGMGVCVCVEGKSSWESVQGLV